MVAPPPNHSGLLDAIAAPAWLEAPDGRVKVNAGFESWGAAAIRMAPEARGRTIAAHGDAPQAGREYPSLAAALGGLVHPGDLSALLVAWRGSAAQNLAFNVEARLRAKNGGFRWARFTAPTCVGRVGSWQDVHDARRNDEVTAGLSDLAGALRKASDAASVAQALVTRGARALGAVAGLLWGLDERGETLVVTAHAGLPAAVTDGLASLPLGADSAASRALGTGRVQWSDTMSDAPQAAWGELPPGSERWSLAAAPLLGGNARGVLGLVFAGPATLTSGELTALQSLAAMAAQALDRVSLHGQLRVATARLDALFNSISLGVLCQDEAGRVTSLNPAAERILGVPSAQLLGETSAGNMLLDLRLEDGRAFPPDARPLALARTSGRAAGPMIVTHFDPIRGEQRLFRITGVPLSVGVLPCPAYAVFEDITDQQETRETLLNTLATMSDGLLLLDREGRVTHANPAALRLAEGYGDLTGLRLVEALPELEGSPFQLAFQETLRGGRPTSVTAEFRTFGRQVRARFHPSLNGVSVFITDETERVDAQAALIETESRLRLLAENARDLIFEYSLALRGFTYISSAAEALTGFTAAELTADPGRAIALLSPQARADLGRALSSGDRRPVELSWAHRDGRILRLECNGVEVRDASGRVQGVKGIIRDLTERRRAQAALEESELRFRSLMDANIIGIVVADASGKVSIANDEYLRLTGSSREDLQAGRVNWVSLTPPEHLERDRAALAELERGGRAALYEKDYLRPDGTRVPVMSAPMSLKGGDGHEVIAVSLDLTPLKAHEAALARSENRYRTLVASIAQIVWEGRAGEGITAISGWAEYSGEPPASALGWGFLDFVHPDDVAATVKTLDEAFESGDGFNIKYRLRARNNEYRWFDARATRAPGTRDWIGLTADIHDAETSAREAKESRLELEQFKRALDEHSPVSTTNIDGTITYVNDKYVAYSGYSRDELIGANHRIVKSGLHDLAFWETFWGVIQAGQVLHTNVASRHKDGRVIEAASTVVPFLDGAGKPYKFTAIRTDITDLRQREAEVSALNVQLRQRLDRIAGLHNIDTAITASLDVRVTLGILIEQVRTQLQAHAVGVYTLAPGALNLELAARAGFDAPPREASLIRLGAGLTGRAALEGRTLSLDERGLDAKTIQAEHLSEAFRAMISVPLSSKGAVIGVLSIYQREALPQDPDWLDFLHVLAGQAAIAIENATLFESLQRKNLELGLAYDETIEGWSKALDLRDHETEGHSQRVTAWTMRLARQMNVPEALFTHMRRGALLHDIGKMGVPDSVLLKPGPLDPDEWVIMRAHTTHAADLLRPISYLRPALDIPEFHHERWDGSGYPHGLAGENIPLAARIFAVIDVFDALTSHRPYRAAWTTEAAIEHIRAGSGTQFDANVVRAFNALVAG